MLQALFTQWYEFISVWHYINIINFNICVKIGCDKYVLTKNLLCWCDVLLSEKYRVYVTVQVPLCCAAYYICWGDGTVNSFLILSNVIAPFAALRIFISAAWIFFSFQLFTCPCFSPIYQLWSLHYLIELCISHFRGLLILPYRTWYRYNLLSKSFSSYVITYCIPNIENGNLFQNE